LNHPLYTKMRAALLDCVSSRDHSHDFSFYRSELLLERVRLFAALFGLASPAWILVDRWLLPEDILGAMLGLRVVTGLVLLLLALVPVKPTLNSARLRITALVVVVMGFYAFVEVLTGGTYPSPGLIGYTILPVLLVGVLSLLPLTILESSAALALIALTVFGTHFSIASLGDAGVLGLFWVLLLFIGFALLAQIFQLRLLLLIHRQATRDALTGLFNRGALLRHAAHVLADCKKREVSYSVLMIDLDRFKLINDTYGHLAGDKVLRAVARVISGSLSPSYLPGRFGGEEFLLLMPDADLEKALEHAERLRAAVEELVVKTGSGPLKVTTSIGVAVGEPGDPLEEVVHRADQSLYSAKESGRNFVVS